MSPLQKSSVFGIVISTISIVSFILLLLFKNYPTAFSAFAILGIYGLTPRIFYRKSGKRVLFDERDKEIARKGNKAGFWAFWSIFTTAAVIVSLVKGDGTIPASSPVYAVLGGMIIIIVTRSITILTLYRQGR